MVMKTQEQRNEFLKELYDYLEFKMNNMKYNGEIMSLNKGICFTVSKMAAKIMRRLGYDCIVQRIEYVIGNEGGKKKFLQFLKDGIKPNYVDDEWIIGLGSDLADELGAHYVVYFKENKLILDLTIGQSTRKDKGIILKPYFTKIEEELPKEIIMYSMKGPNEEYELSTSYYLPEAKEYYNHIIEEGYRKLKRWKK